jgi:queuine tRNA-ribosyltransferase
MFSFKIAAQDGLARAGTLETPHGSIQTPVFMPVGTHGAVKGVSPAELREVGSEIILGNTYHLHLRPGDERIAALGGLHRFMGWDGPLLTDSGGFQVFSLGERSIRGAAKQPLRQVSEEGITFQSHIDGSRRFISPETSIAIQQNLGADIIMAFDQPVYGMSGEVAAEEAMHRTHRWLERSIAQWQRGDTAKQALFGIVQGGTHTRLHRESAAFVRACNLPGNAIGGLAVGEAKKTMWEATESITSLLPEDKPRYFMGLGEPSDCIEAVVRGVDMFDCVAPSRLARHAAVWVVTGPGTTAFWAGDTEALIEQGVQIDRWNLLRASFADDSLTLVPDGVLPGLPNFSRATLHHYLQQREMLGMRFLTLNNIAVLTKITQHTRRAVLQQQVAAFREAIKTG